MTEPKSTLIVVCSECGEPWDIHEQMAKTWDEEGTAVWNPITKDFCIAILKNRFMGPPGPPGPMGMMGAPSDTIYHGPMTEDEYREWLASRQNEDRV